MPRVLQPKVGVVSCSGEELAEGTVARLATLKVLRELRPGRTVTICLPLFVARGEGDREFARTHPTVTVDGCALRCAARATERYSARPAASVVVADLVADAGLPRPEGRRALDQAGRKAVTLVAERVAALVDALAAGERPAAGAPAPPAGGEDAGTGTCTCRSRRGSEG